MPNNRKAIEERGEDRIEVISDGANQKEAVLDMGRALVMGPIKIGKGLIKRYRVNEGTEAVILRDGKHVRTIGPGGYFTVGISLFWRIEQYVVSVRERILDVDLQDEVYITYTQNGDENTGIDNKRQVPVSLHVMVNYCVVNPTTVALEIDKPVHALYDIVDDALQDTVAGMTYDQFVRGACTGSRIRDILEGKDLPSTLGIEVTDVLVSSYKGNAQIDKEQIRRAEELEKARIAAEVGRLIGVSSDVILLTDFTLEKLRMFTEMLRSGAMSFEQARALFLTPKNEPSRDAAGSDLLTPFIELHRQAQAGNIAGGATDPSNTSAKDRPVTVGRERVLADVEQLRSSGLDTHGPVDPGGGGRISVATMLPDGNGHLLFIYFHCPSDYPRTPPTVEVEQAKVEGGTVVGHPQVLSFVPPLLRRWTSTTTLSDIVQEVQEALCTGENIAS